MSSRNRIAQYSFFAKCLAAIGLVVLTPQVSQAGTITFSFEGNATGVSANGMDPALIGVTLPFTGTFTLNDNDLDALITTGEYDCAGCPGPIWTLEIAGLSVAGNMATLEMSTAGQFVVNLTNTATAGFYPESFVLFGLGYAAGTFADDSLPADIQYPILTQASRIQLYRPSDPHLYFFPVTLTAPGDTSVVPEPGAVVPEPGALVLLGTGLLILGSRAARRRATSGRQNG